MSAWLAWSLRAGILFAIVGAWQWRVSSSDYWLDVLSSPAEVWSVLGDWFGDPTFWADVRTTGTVAVLGYALGLLVATLLIAITVPSRVLDRLLSPFIALTNSLPKLALAPLLIMWFGIGMESKVYFVGATIFFIVFFGVYSGLKAINPLLVANVRGLGANGRQLIRALYLPATVTWIIASLRVSVSWALLAAVVSEYLGSNQGVGYRIAQGERVLRTDIVLAGIFLVAAVAVLIDRGLTRVERRWNQWRAF